MFLKSHEPTFALHLYAMHSCPVQSELDMHSTPHLPFAIFDSTLFLHPSVPVTQSYCLFARHSLVSHSFVQEGVVSAGCASSYPPSGHI